MRTSSAGSALRIMLKWTELVFELLPFPVSSLVTFLSKVFIEMIVFA